MRKQGKRTGWKTEEGTALSPGQGADYSRSNRICLLVFVLSTAAAFLLAHVPTFFGGESVKGVFSQLGGDMLRGFDGSGLTAEAPQDAAWIVAPGTEEGPAEKPEAEPGSSGTEVEQGDPTGQPGGETEGDSGGAFEEPKEEGGDAKDPGTEEPEPAEPFTMEDALFIGDSRTVGLSEYSGIEGADFYDLVGLSVYNIFSKEGYFNIEEKMMLEDVLQQKEYGKLYVMIGINEIGADLETSARKYGELLDYLAQMQPWARIFVQANLHVTGEKSDSDRYINNGRLNAYNEMLREFADGERIFFLDVNPYFDDEDGALRSTASSDGVHITAKYYIEWGRWICQMTELILSGEIRESLAEGEEALVRPGDASYQAGLLYYSGSGREGMRAEE